MAYKVVKCVTKGGIATYNSFPNTDVGGLA